MLHGIPTPILDTPENMEKVDLRRQAIVQKCACKKSGCDPTRKYCKCVKNGRRCTILCKCTGCNNVKEPRRVLTPASEGDSSSSDASDDAPVLRNSYHMMHLSQDSLAIQTMMSLMFEKFYVYDNAK